MFLRCVERSPRCPKCNSAIGAIDLVPNSLVADLVKKYQPQQEEKDKIFENCINDSGGKDGFLKEYLNEAIKTVNISDINSIEEFIADR